METILQATTRVQLDTSLAAIDTTVPLRTEGRTTQHTERYAVVRLLTVVLRGEFKYPVALVHRDRPDFLLSLGDTDIGIEHTEAVLENEAHSSALRESGFGAEVQFLSRALPGEPKRSRKELIEELELNKAGNGWGGDSVEREWAAAMLHAAQRKIEALNSPGFDRFEQNWLLIYDNCPLPALHEDEAAPILHQSFQRYSAFEQFDHIFVLSDQWLWEFSNREARVHATRVS